MKNACILLKKRISVESEGANEVLAVFRRDGYTFEEILIMLQANEARLRAVIAQRKGECDILLLLCDHSSLPIVQSYLAGIVTEKERVSEYANAAIYQLGGCTLFLLSTDETETGIGFAYNACLPYLQKKNGGRLENLVIRCMGVNEARIQSLIAQAELYAAGKVRIAHLRKYDEDILEIAYDCTTPKIVVDEVVRMFAVGLEDTVYAMKDISLEEQLVAALKLRGKKLSIAESFTGGGIAKRITSVSGASEVYFEGLNTYDELSKLKRLGVSEFSLRTAGAVSDQTAYEMALGLLNTGDCELAIATTGLAGPKSDRTMLPVGLCYIAVGTKEKIFVYRYKFDGTRKEITEKAINYALFLAYKLLKNW